MTIRYARTLPPNAGVREYEATATHIRHHLSSVASAEDDPTVFAAQVQIARTERDDGSVDLVGTLDREPQADYLRPDFDPEQDVSANPLSVPSIEDLP